MRTNKFTRMARLFLALLICVFGMTTVMAQPVTGPGVDPNALLLLDFENGNIANWSATNTQQNRGEKQNVELMDAEKGDPVRFGRYAIKLNWDFTASVSATTLGSYFSPPDNAFTIPAASRGGSHKIGMWIYASPECEGVIWFRLQLFTPPGTAGSASSVLNEFVGEPSYVYWTGWKYHEFTFPNKANANKELGPPLTTTPSYAMFRLMSVSNATTQRPLTKGYFIIDNVRVTSVTEDTTRPTVNTITGNGTTLPSTGSGPTFTEGTVNLSATFSDPGSSSSGVNYNSIRMTVDGYLFKAGDAGFAVNQETNTVTLTGINLSNGTHNLEVYLEDNFGNIGTKTGMFTVEDPQGIATNVTLAPDVQALVGNTFKMKVNTNDSKNIKELELVLELNQYGSVDEINGVTFAPSAQAGSSYSFNSRLGLLTINLKNDITANAVETLATINVNISKNSDPTDVLRCSPVTAKAVYADNSLSLFSLFSAFTRDILATYNVTIVKRIVGVPGEILITDQNENPVSGVTVYALNADKTSVLAQAVTDATGIASGMNFTASAQNVNIYAEKEGKYSHTIPIRTLTAQLTNVPGFIRSGAAPDPKTSKTITWMSSPQTSTGPAIIKIAKESDGESAFQQYTGATKILEFDVSSSVAKGSSVTVKGLEPGTTYIYQVGDGTTWSPTRKFTTTTATNKFSFGAFGDLQASTTALMSRWMAAAATMEAMPQKPFFSVNVGDINDTDDNFGYCSVYGYMLNEHPVYANIDMVSAYGNHEYMGGAVNCKFMNGHPGADNPPLIGTGTYAVEYGNLIVVSLDWEARGYASANALMTAQAEWMDNILSKSDKTWKIVTLHYPVFPSASTPGSQAIYGPVFDKHNVQLVLCGHGHTYERVQAKEGTVTSGSNKRTFQPVTGNGTLHIQMGDMTQTGNNGRWILFEVDGPTMSATVRDANNSVVTNECFTLQTTELSDVESLFSPNLQIYPNPFRSVLHITGAENSTLQVMNIVGTVVHTQKISGTNETVPLEHLPAGIYFCRLEKDGQLKTVKVVKI